MTPRFETFSFLPPMTPTQVRMQADSMLQKNLVPMIEFLENPTFDDSYWRNWPIPEHKDISATWVMTQVDACSRRNPYAFIRLSGYDPKARICKQAFIVKTPMEVN